MDILIEYLKNTCEYKVMCNEEIIACSPNYVLLEESDLLCSNVYNFEDKFYEKSEITFKIDECCYNIFKYVDVTKYVKEVKKSKIDCLTKLPNRMQIEKYLKDYDKECIIVMSDIDDFKKVNDIYGHQQGDSAIKIIGDLIRNSISENDFAGRYGGEEFLIVFNTNDVDLVKSKMEKMKECLIKYTKPLNITISTGIYKFNPDNDRIKDAIRKADETLYYVKKNGKNAVKLYDEIKK